MAAQRCVALLRAVNLAGKNAVAMADLRALLAGLGLGDPRSLLQSGNLVFSSTGRTPTQLERLLEGECARRLGLSTELFVRTAAEWQALVAANPFALEAQRDPGHLLAMTLREAPSPAALEALRAAIQGRERACLAGRTAYLVYPDGVGRSRLTTALIEKKLGTRGTARNWNTVLKLQAALQG